MIGGIKKITPAEKAEQYRQDRWAVVSQRWKALTEPVKNKPELSVK